MARILVIDDDHAVRLTIQVILECEGHEVVLAADGEHGMRAVTSTSPQLIFTDIIMPNKDGLETIMQIRAHDATTPIIAMSGGGRVGNADFLKMAVKLAPTRSWRSRSSGRNWSTRCGGCYRLITPGVSRQVSRGATPP